MSAGDTMRTARTAADGLRAAVASSTTCTRHGQRDGDPADEACCLPHNVHEAAALADARRTLIDEARRTTDEIAAARDAMYAEIGYDPDRHNCPLCCPREGHVTPTMPYWLTTSDMVPAHWRFIYHVVHNAEASNQELADAAALFAQVYGDRALAQAIREAKATPMPHPMTWNPMWDGMAQRLHKART